MSLRITATWWIIKYRHIGLRWHGLHCFSSWKSQHFDFVGKRFRWQFLLPKLSKLSAGRKSCTVHVHHQWSAGKQIFNLTSPLCFVRRTRALDFVRRVGPCRESSQARTTISTNNPHNSQRNKQQLSVTFCNYLKVPGSCPRWKYLAIN